jgi:adenylyltransferase/sulfurtransferase
MSKQIKTITVEELKRMTDEKSDFQLIDVREKHEKDFSDIGGELIPMGDVVANANKISREKMVVVYCRSGRRSANIIRELQEKFGFSNLYNLTGGILEWADKVDQSVKKY